MIVNETAIHQNRQNFDFNRSRDGLQQWSGIHTAKQAVKGPEKKCEIIHINDNRTNQ